MNTPFWRLVNVDPYYLVTMIVVIVLEGILRNSVVTDKTLVND